MNRCLMLMIAFMLFSIGSFAQHETDFAEHFMAVCGTPTSLTCETISPTMMKKMRMRVRQNEKISEKEVAIFDAIQTVRVVSAVHHDIDHKYEQCTMNLLQENAHRYKLLLSKGEKQVYGRKKGKIYVELILLSSELPFKLIDITGVFDPETFKDLPLID